MHYDPEYLLKRFTDHFKQKYKVECISALHHNKRKTKRMCGVDSQESYI